MNFTARAGCKVVAVDWWKLFNGVVMPKPRVRKRKSPKKLQRAILLAEEAIATMLADEDEIAGDLNPTSAAMALLYQSIDSLHPSPTPPTPTDGTPRPLASPGMLAVIIDRNDWHHGDCGVVEQIHDAGAGIKIEGVNGSVIKEWRHVALVNPQADPAHLPGAVKVRRQCAAALAASLDVANHLLACIDRLTLEVKEVFEDGGPVGIAGPDKRHDQIATHLQDAIELLWSNVGELAGSLNPPLRLGLLDAPAAGGEGMDAIFASAIHRAFATCPQLQKQPPTAQPTKAKSTRAVAGQ